ncbi:ADP compounds hydrolase NudE [Ketobacter sp.]|uniref:ADP compounds hydrolase NudE n=1 Tax=Ketobacter sp. TaxID=2083498 RepID=UPI000F11ECD8|nr:ADP compounds hydrolase NudE [Ketobacter sp.]RLU00629.1 MAG: ADP compounds hydrolase NudE [Ketobacter sp.]
MPQKPTILDHQLVAESRLFGIERLQLRFSNGEERVYERLRTPRIPAVLVVAVKDNGNVLLVREYACGTHNYQLALPKGAMDGHETVFEAANRELMEEAGYGARAFTELKALSMSPGYMGHMIHVVLAEDLYEKTLSGDEPEPLERVEHPLEDIDSLLLMDDFTEARSLAALYMVRDIMRNRK